MRDDSQLPGASPVEVALVGHLTREQLAASLKPVEQAMSGDKRSCYVLVDCRKMTGYETDARDYFSAWNSRYRSRIARLAVVTDRIMWHLVVSGMALASASDMKAFSDREAALFWLKALY